MQFSVKNHILLIVIGTALLLNSCKKDLKTGELRLPKGSLQMIDSLDAIYARTDFMMHPYEKDTTIKVFRQIIANNHRVTPDQVFTMATEFTRGGDPQTGIDLISRLFTAIPISAEMNQNNKKLYDLLAVAHLRQGEVQNCITNHNEESCIFPIQGKGIHTNTTGSIASIQVLNKILTAFPDDLQSRYLLNLAYMTLGTYPEDVPKKWLIPPTAFASEVAFSKFKNIATMLGLDMNSLAGGVITEDFDNDGFVDIMLCSWLMKDKLFFFKNMGNGAFEDRTKQALLTGMTGGLNMQQTDYNNDGFIDILVLRSAWKPIKKVGIQPNSLLKNNGDGTFEDVTIAAGLYSINPTQTATWFDYDNDGFLDVYIGNETTPGFNEIYPCEFYHNNGNGTFTNVAKDYGMDVKGFVKGVKAGDINNDGLYDLYVSRLDGDNYLFLNKGGNNVKDWKFENISANAGVEKPYYSFPVWFFDANNDGYEDIFVGAYDSTAFKRMAGETAADWLKKPFTADPCRLYLNNKNNSFTDATAQFGLNHPLQTMGCNYGDFNNDGFLDFYLGTGSPDLSSVVPNKMYINEKGQRFRDVTTASGTGNVQKGHGVSIADLDNDGDLDIFAKMGGAYTGDKAPNCVFENPGFGNNFLVLKLVGKTANRAAIGAKVKIQYTDDKGNKLTSYQIISSGASFGANSLQLEAGLGKSTKIDLVEVTWPNKNRSKQVFTGISVNKKYQLEEGQENAKELPYNKITFMDHSAGGHHHQL